MILDWSFKIFITLFSKRIVIYILARAPDWGVWIQCPAKNLSHSPHTAECFWSPAFCMAFTLFESLIPRALVANPEPLRQKSSYPASSEIPSGAPLQYMQIFVYKPQRVLSPTQAFYSLKEWNKYFSYSHISIRIFRNGIWTTVNDFYNYTSWMCFYYGHIYLMNNALPWTPGSNLVLSWFH